MIAVLLADGFEEIEALTPVDMLRRAGYDVKTVGITGKIVCGSHKIPVICDTVPDEIELDKVSLAVFPGGMPGALNLDSADFTDKIISAVIKNGGRLAAICAAPLILGRRGLLKNKRAVCYPGFEKYLIGANISAKSVVVDENYITAKGMGVAGPFGLALVTALFGEECAQELFRATMMQ
jgi:4-methyl-5(b-hydroxyethyl)-thiazole monophosphate biosynthesis